MKTIVSTLFVITSLFLTPAFSATAADEGYTHYVSAKKQAKQGNWMAAVREYQMAAYAGDRAAKVDLALYYLRGHGGLPQLPEKAEQMLIESADDGDARASRILASLYRENNYGLAVDVAKANYYGQLSTLYLAHRLSQSMIKG